MNVDNAHILFQAVLQSDQEPANNASVTAIGSSTITCAANHGFVVGDLVVLAGSDANLGTIRLITSLATNVLTVTGVLTSESSPTGVTLHKFGVQTSAGAIGVSTTGDLVALTSSTFDFTTLGVVKNDAIYLGGEADATHFDDDKNNGWKIVHSVSANRLVISYSKENMTTLATGHSKTIQIFIGDRTRDRDGDNSNERCYLIGRTLGRRRKPAGGQFMFPDHQYVQGALANTMTLTLSHCRFPHDCLWFCR